MKKLSFLFVTLITLSILLSGCGGTKDAKNDTGSPKSVEITVSAASSLSESLNEIERNFAKQNSNVKLIFNFGASGTLQQQIEQGAPADLFISAGKSQMDELEKKNLIIKESRLDLLGNELVLIVPKDNKNISNLQDLLKPEISKISLGTPETVPAGKYTQEALTNLKLWEALQTKFVLARDVKQVLTYVETGNVEAGFVYKSDAIGSDKVKVVSVIQEDSHKPIVYPAALVASAKNKQAAGEFLKYLQSPEAKQILAKYGFKNITK